MLPIAKFAWERLEFLLAPPQEREQQQLVGLCVPCYFIACGEIHLGRLNIHMMRLNPDSSD